MTDDELEAMVHTDPPRGYRALLVASVVSGVLCFGSTIWMSQLLAPPDASSGVEITPLLLVLLAVFAVTLAGCIAMGYAAARRRPPSD
ncbi:MAG TPA: hypothetical protein VIJ41_08915 [Candidatus Nanopelagicales bacterium]|jgi:4-hydroxybenzoate polyprenyltransferase